MTVYTYRFVRIRWETVRSMDVELATKLQQGERVIGMSAVADSMLLLVERAP